MPTPEKEAVIKEVSEVFKKAQGIFITDYKGLNVAQMTELRHKCRESSVGYRVIKNTLAKIAAREVGYNEMVEYLQGPSAIAFSYEDASAPARIISEFAKKAEKPTIKMSIFEGNFYGPAKVKEIANLPSKNEMYTQLVRGVNSPLQGLVGNLNGILLKLVRTLVSVKEKKEKE
ncbi:MAG: 50S ribosomal protein L10 [bacterium]